jgi:hypothetical protein
MQGAPLFHGMCPRIGEGPGGIRHGLGFLSVHEHCELDQAGGGALGEE